MKKILITLIFSLSPLLLSAQNTPAANVDLLWEAETYTPPAYAGRRLPSPGSLVRVVALTSESQPIFYWKKDGLDIRSASGAGKNILEYFAANRVGGGNVLEVKVLNPEGDLVGASETTIPVVSPQIIFYQLDGETAPSVNYRQALSKLNPQTDRTGIIAEPFYFSTADWLNKHLLFDWRADGEKIETNTEDPRFLTIVKNPGSGTGERLLNLRINNRNLPLQNTFNQLPVLFGVSEFGF